MKQFPPHDQPAFPEVRATIRVALERLWTGEVDAAARKLEHYLRLVLREAPASDLTAISSPRRALRELLMPAVWAAGLIRPLPGWLAMDIGAGSGVYAAALAILYAGSRVVAVESNQGKAEFIAHAGRALELSNLEILASRAENTARTKEFTGAAMVVGGRALGGLQYTLDVCRPFLSESGRMVLWLPEEELVQARKEGSARGLEPETWFDLGEYVAGLKLAVLIRRKA